MSIRLRLTLWYSTILAVTLIAFGIVVYLSLSYLLYNNQKQQMERLSKEIESQITRVTFYFQGQPRQVMRLPELNEFRYSGFFIQVVDREGAVESKNIRTALPVPSSALNGNGSKNPFYFQTSIDPYPFTFLIYNKPLYFNNQTNDQFVGILQVATTIDDIRGTLGTLRTTLVVLALVTILLAASLGWFLSRKALQPIDVMISAAEQIHRNIDLDRRIHYIGPKDELGRLADTINGMLSRIQTVYSDLEQALKAQKRFVSDASHELRTPLTTIRGNVELLEKMWKQKLTEGKSAGEPQNELTLEAMRDIAGEAERMSRLVSDLLSLARADAGYEMRRASVELKPMVEDVARRAGFLPRKAEWVVGDLDPLEQAVVLGDRDYLQQLLFIFIENAFKYTEEGFVRLDAVVRGGSVGLRITDTGIGMDKEDVPHIFERFYRADPSRGEKAGTGLGLSIAKWILDEHGGTVEVLTQRGTGTSFVIWLPLH